MRYLVISDIHANLEAFETVMAEAKPLGYDKVLLLGDLVGYGADPNAICERVRDLKPDALIRGNHDKVGSGVESPEGFNAVARNAIRWTYETLTQGEPRVARGAAGRTDDRRRHDRDLPRHAVR